MNHAAFNHARLLRLAALFTAWTLLVGSVVVFGASTAATRPSAERLTPPKQYESVQLQELVDRASAQVRGPDRRVAAEAVRLFFDLQRSDLLAVALGPDEPDTRRVALDYVKRLGVDRQREVVLLTLTDSALFRVEKFGELRAARLIFLDEYTDLVRKVCDVYKVPFGETPLDEERTRVRLHQLLVATTE